MPSALAVLRLIEMTSPPVSTMKLFCTEPLMTPRTSARRWKRIGSSTSAGGSGGSSRAITRRWFR